MNLYISSAGQNRRGYRRNPGHRGRARKPVTQNPPDVGPGRGFGVKGCSGRCNCLLAGRDAIIFV